MRLAYDMDDATDSLQKLTLFVRNQKFISS